MQQQREAAAGYCSCNAVMRASLQPICCCCCLSQCGYSLYVSLQPTTSVLRDIWQQQELLITPAAATSAAATRLAYGGLDDALWHSLCLLQAFGRPAAAGATAAQVVAALARIGCCCIAISNDLRPSSLQQHVQQKELLRLPHPPADDADVDAAARLAAAADSSKNHSSRSSNCDAFSYHSISSCLHGHAATGRERVHLSLHLLGATVKAIILPGAGTLALCYVGCFVAAAALQAAMHLAASDPAGTYDSQYLTLRGIVVPLWVADISLGIAIFAAAAVAAGPLLLHHAQAAYRTAAAAAEADRLFLSASTADARGPPDGIPSGRECLAT